MPNIVVGMDNCINAVKQIILQNDVDWLGITGMGANHLTVSIFMVRVGFFMPSGRHARWATHVEGHSTVVDGRIYGLSIICRYYFGSNGLFTGLNPVHSTPSYVRWVIPFRAILILYALFKQGITGNLINCIPRPPNQDDWMMYCMFMISGSPIP